MTDGLYLGNARLIQHSKILIKIKFWSKQTNERDLTPICLLGKKRLTVLLYDMYVKYQNTTYTLRK